MDEREEHISRGEFVRRGVGTIGAISVLAPGSALAKTSSPSGDVQKTNVLTIAREDTPPSLDSGQASSLFIDDLNGNIYGADITRFKVVRDPKTGVLVADVRASGPTGGIIPGLAESYKVSKDLRTFEFKLRKEPGSFFGNPPTAMGVKWAFDRSNALPGTGVFFNTVMFTRSPKSIQVVDDRTVRFHLPRPNPIFLKIDAMRHLGIYDLTEIKKHITPGDPWAKKWLNNHDAGFGPYHVESIRKGQQMTLVVNPNYLLGKPAMQKVIWRIVPSSSDRLALLARGDVDVAANLTPRQLKQLEGNKNVKILSYTSNEFTNLRLQIKNFKPFQDRRVRQALAYAIPYKQIIDDVYFGMATRMKSPLPEIIPGYTADFWPYNTNPAKAQSLLKQAGVGNFTFEITYDVTNSVDEQVATIIRTALAPLGITANLKGVPTAVYSEIEVKGTFDALLGLNWPFIPDAGYHLILYWSSNAFWNGGRWSNREFDRVVNRMQGEVNDKKRLGEIRRAQQIFAEEMPWVLLVNPGYHVAHRADLTGFAWFSDNSIRYEGVRRI